MTSRLVGRFGFARGLWLITLASTDGGTSGRVNRLGAWVVARGLWLITLASTDGD